MKKLIQLLMACAMIFALAGCQKEETKTTSIKDATELLTTLWNHYEFKDEVSVLGGDLNNVVDNAPGKFDITDTMSMQSYFVVSEENAALVDDCASVMHMMNANTMTIAAFHIKDSKQVKTFQTLLKESVMTNQWMCGFPEVYISIAVDDYVVSMFGEKQLIESFKDTTVKHYTQAKVVVEEAF